MTLSLPEDIEPFLLKEHNYERLRGPAVYALTLTRPDNLPNAWDDAFDHRPPYFNELQNADEIMYVGAAKDVLARLTDHKDGEKRLTVLTEVCGIDALRNIYWYESAEEAFQHESKTALMMQQEYPNYYVHQR